MSLETVDHLRSVAEPYINLSGAATATLSSYGPEENFVVAYEDIPEILLVAGIRTADEPTVEEASRELRVFLPGLLSGQLCFQVIMFIIHHKYELIAYDVIALLQELLAIYNYLNVKKVPDNIVPKDMMRSMTKERKNYFHTDEPTNLFSNSGFTAQQHHKSTVSSSDYMFKIDTRSVPKSTSLSNKTNRSDDDNTVHRLWALPSRTKFPLSKDTILKEFRRLDLAGDGKLTFLTVRSALELQGLGESMSDAELRQWLRQHDIDRKGYLDFKDFQRIYADNPSNQFQSSDMFYDDSERNVVDDNYENSLERGSSAMDWERTQSNSQPSKTQVLQM